MSQGVASSLRRSHESRSGSEPLRRPGSLGPPLGEPFIVPKPLGGWRVPAASYGAMAAEETGAPGHLWSTCCVQQALI